MEETKIIIKDKIRKKYGKKWLPLIDEAIEMDFVINYLLYHSPHSASSQYS